MEPPAFPLEVALRDGTTVLIRPIEPHDKQRMIDGFERLSEESRYRRFLAPVTRLSEEQLTNLTEVDHVDHEALVALAADEAGQPGLGVARYVRLTDRPTVAEAAVTVVDDAQGKGLGSVLLALLGQVARERGIERFRAYVLESNRPMLEILEQLGAEAHRDSPGLLVVDAVLPTEPEDAPGEVARRVLRAVAQGKVGEVVPDAGLRRRPPG
ncbi:MAG TPA: GNAT family N-acetyltransferase [Actinomycetota bacterium]|nr:GNAT family N-acetyltransferase [Actinomycetota bacterium]